MQLSAWPPIRIGKCPLQSLLSACTSHRSQQIEELNRGAQSYSTVLHLPLVLTGGGPHLLARAP